MCPKDVDRIYWFSVTDALASDEDEIDEAGQQYLEKLEKSVRLLFLVRL